MKRTLFVLLGAVLVLMLLAYSPAPVQAQTGTYCITSPATGSIPQVFTIDCFGFTPGAYLYPYVVEPDGTAGSGELYGLKALRTNQDGRATFQFYTDWGYGYFAALGTWTIVVEELGPGGVKIHSVANKFTVNGPNSSVNRAALLRGDSTLVRKGELLTLSGSGFAPNEFVSLWVGLPNGDCSSFTVHSGSFEVITPGFSVAEQNSAFFNGTSVEELGTYKASADGTLKIAIRFNPYACEGTYQIVARGVTSGASDDWFVTVTSNVPTMNALLVASKDTLYAMNDVISFAGSSFAANEPVNCWTTQTQGQAFPVFQDIRANGAGEFKFSIISGFWYHFQMPGVNDTFALSEGPLGVAAMTCRGANSGRVGVATYTVAGSMLTP